MHKMMCKACSDYEKQSTIIERKLSMMQPTKQAPVDLEKLMLKINQKIDDAHEGRS